VGDVPPGTWKGFWLGVVIDVTANAGFAATTMNTPEMSVSRARTENRRMCVSSFLVGVGARAGT
jgi:hypothetical protein